MRKRIGLVTIHRANNAGAVLQAFSSCRAIESLGHDCEIIDYWPRDDLSSRIQRTLSIRGLVFQADRFLFFRKRRHQRRRFHQFQERLPIRAPTLHSVCDVREARFNYDVYVCGSDQIWNPSLLARGIGEPYYLDFVRNGEVRRVSYAPSFGVDEIPHGQRGPMAQLIGKINALSVREKSGVRIVEELTGRKAEHVLDPTLLVQPGEFADITDNPDFDFPFMFVYPTQYPKNPSQVNVMRRLATELGTRMVVAMPRTFHPKWLLENTKFLWDVGPKQFLGLVKKATYIVTNSYHGTALSIAFGKNFAVIPHAHYNTRMESLLSILDLQSRQLAVNASPRNVDQYLEPVAYAKVEPLLAKERKRSREFLRRSIED